MTDAVSPDPSPDVAAASLPPRRYRWNVGWPPVLEVLLIALGVFLGLAGEQWRERADRRDRAHEALRPIRAEVGMNEAEVAKVRDDDIVLLEKSLAILYKEIGPPIDRELDR